ncbi:hypothetical protein BDR26DRAFT_861999 [Obelidium mucronatum]|nr:hypothetical protein BDR26DRAFT_861999 [Obelidium mucronatum]
MSRHRHGPLLMAMLVPIATFLNVQSLTVPLAWIQSHDSAQSVRPILTAGFAALAFGILATVSDFMRMLEKKIKWTTRLIIFGATVQGIINMSVVALYCWFLFRPQQSASSSSSLFVYTDGIFFTFMSAVTSLMAAYHCYHELQINTGENQVYIFCMNSLSPNQRQLTILTILSFLYIILAGWIFNFLEDWDLNEALYFIVVVSTSIGFGDLAPQTTLGKVTLIPVALIGLGLVGLNIFAARQVLLEMFTIQLAETFSRKFGMKQEHHGGSHSIDDSAMSYGGGRRSASNSSFSQNSSDVGPPPRGSSSSSAAAASACLRDSSSSSLLPPSAAAPQYFSPLDTPAAAEFTPRSSSRHRVSPSLVGIRHPSRTMTLTRGGSGVYPKLTLFGDSQIRRRMVVTATKEIVSMQINQAVFLVLATMLLFASVFSFIEGWNFWDGLYFTFTTVATIGFGDFCPTTPLARSLFIWFVFFGIANVTYLGSMISERVMNQWIVTVGLIEDRVGRYEVKARIKREWGAVGGSSSSSPAPSPILVGNNDIAPMLPVPRIVRISNPAHPYGSSLPTRLFHTRADFGDEEFSDDDDDDDDGEHVETDLGTSGRVGLGVTQSEAAGSHVIPGQRFSTSPSNDPQQPRSPPPTRPSPSSIRVFSARPKKRMSRVSISENESLLG